MELHWSQNANFRPLHSAITSITPQELQAIIEPIPQNQLIELLLTAALRHFDVLVSVRSIADREATLRKLFVRCLSSETTSGTLRRVFSPFGPIENAVAIFDRTTGNTRGYGFVTFKHIEGAIMALKQPTKRIDGRMTVTTLASAGVSNCDDQVWKRKIYVWNIPFVISSNTLLDHFMMYGEVEEGPIAYHYKGNGKTKGFAFFVYRTEEAAKASLRKPMKMIDGYRVHCKLADVGKKGNTPPAPPETSASASAPEVSLDGVINQKKKQQQQQCSDMISPPQFGVYSGGGFQDHPTLHASSPMVASPFGDWGDGGEFVGGIGGDYGEYGGWLSPSSSDVGMPATVRGFQDGYADQQSMELPKLLPREMVKSVSPTTYL